tara:strand:- start:63 stop:683 length:621 start_codon:yes stop_codon:yes gene_type:complete
MAVDLPTPFSFTNIFKLHAVVAFVFLLPVLNGGLKGFIETITEGESAAPRHFAASRVNHAARASSGRNVAPSRSAKSAKRARRVPARATRPGGEATRRATARVSPRERAVGHLSQPDEWHMMVFGVDFVKNIMIFFQCLAGIRMREPEQRMLAATFMFMTAAALLNMFLFPAGDRMPPMGVGYTVIMTWLYGAAFAQKVDEGKKTK